MSKRLLLLSLCALLVTFSSGCCLTNAVCCWHDAWLERYQATHFCDCGCGETFISSWYNSPPKCCDPCDDWGNFTGRKWWIPCQGCRCGGGCGPGNCPGVSPAARANGPGMGNPQFYDDGTVNPQTISPSGPPMGSPAAEDIPAPYADPQMSRGAQRNYPPQRTSRYPRNYQYQGQVPPRMTSRPPGHQTPADVVPAEYQESDVFYDDDQVNSRAGYQVTTPSANYRR